MEDCAPGQDLIDEAALSQWLDEAGIEVGAPISTRRITSGHSNEVFELRRGGLRLALRRPPRSYNAASAHDMRREFRVLRALWEHAEGVPVPEPIALCQDLEVLGVPFFLMEFVDGAVVRKHAIPVTLDGEPLAARQMSEAMVDTLVAIHGFDWQKAGLADLGRPEGFLERQARRWQAQLDRYRTRPLPVLDEVGEWLAREIPPAHEPTLIHWDYRLDNVVFGKELPVRVISVLDWEVATIGDPLIDLGWMLGCWRDPHENWHIHEAVLGQFPDYANFLSREAVAERYAEYSGRDIQHLPYFIVMGLFKLACLLEGFYTKFLKGQSDDATFGSQMESFVPELGERARRFMQ